MSQRPESTSFDALPPGVRFFADVFTETEANELQDFESELPLEPYMMRGRASRRRIVAFGGGYRGSARRRFTGPRPPERLLTVRNQMAFVAGLDPEDFVQVIYSVYPPGAGIGWHVDLPRFGPDILGVSLGSSASLRFRRKGTRAPILTLALPPKSGYVIGGAARTDWEHNLLPVQAQRVSLTFRSLVGR